MGQRECLEVLEKKEKWMTCKEIEKEIGIHLSSVSESLARLVKSGFIVVKRDESKTHGNLYKINERFNIN